MKIFAWVSLCLAVFLMLSMAATSGTPPLADTATLNLLHDGATPLLDNLMLFFTGMGNLHFLLPACLIAGGWLIRARGWREALFFGVSAGGAFAVNVSIKPWFHRPRPALWASLAPEPDFSFPSGHAMSSMAILLAVVILLRQPGRGPTKATAAAAVGGLLVALVSTSRLYLGVHYPTDVLGGWILAAALVPALARAFRVAPRRSL